ncbi:MAG: DUF6542 domain-containing protein [Mycobacteriales bacterium]
MSTTVRPDRRNPSRAGATSIESGLPGLAAALLAFVIAGVGGAIDIVTGDGLRTLFAGCLIAGVVVASFAARRSQVFYVVVSPPLTCLVLAMVTVLTTSNSAVDLTAAYLAHGFPAIAAAVGAGLLIALLRRLSPHS